MRKNKPYNILSDVFGELAQTADRGRAMHRLNAHQNNSLRILKTREAELFKKAKRLI